MSLYEDISELFAAAITDGQDNEAIVKQAYEDLLGYSDADTMDNAQARIDYWVGKLNAGLTTDNFGAQFLEEAETAQGNLISATTFENNKTVVEAHRAEVEANADATLDELKTVASEARVDDEVSEGDSGTPGETFTLTTSIDDLTGTSGDDTVSGLVETVNNANDGSTFTSADTINAGAGTDTLDLRVSNIAGEATTTTATVSDVEEIEVRNVDAGNSLYTYDGTSTAGLESVGVRAGSASSTTAFTNLQSVVAINVEDDVDELTVTHDTDLLSGSSDTVSINSTDAKVGTLLDISASDNAIEALKIASDGDSSDLRNIDVGTALKTLTVTGSGDIQLDDAGGGGDSFDDVTKVDASDLTGNLDIDMGANDEDLVFTGGSGNDRIAIASGELASADSLDGGQGDGDRLAIDEADISAVSGAASNFEELEFIDSGVTPDLSTDVGGVTTFVYSGGGIITPTNNANDFTHILTADADDIDPNQADAGLANVLNVELRDADIQDGTSADIGDGDDNTINLTSAPNENGNEPDDSGVNIVDGVDVASNGTLNIDGTADLQIDGLANAAVVDATGLDASLEITGSSNVDEITGTSEGDVISGGGGDDTLTGGTGNDTFTELLTTAGAGNTITDFNANSGGEDTLKFDIHTDGGLFSDAFTGSTTLAFVTSLDLANSSVGNTTSIGTVGADSGTTGSTATIPFLFSVADKSLITANTKLTTAGSSGSLLTGLESGTTALAIGFSTGSSKLFAVSLKAKGTADGKLTTVTGTATLATLSNITAVGTNANQIAAGDIQLF